MCEYMQKIRPDMDIGHNIRKLRIENHMTQEEVIARLQLLGVDISRSTYAKLECGLMNIKVSELVGLRNIFSCRFDDFFEGLELEDDQ